MDRSVCGVVVFELLEQGLFVSRRVELDDFLRVKLVDRVNVLSEFGSRSCLDLLNLLETF